MTYSIKAYIEVGQPVGDFLTALLSNDLMKAVSRADDNNQRNLVAWCKWLYNEAPALCFGSPEKVKLWLSHRGLEGLDAYEANQTKESN
jgi:hypothetical protein